MTDESELPPLAGPKFEEDFRLLKVDDEEEDFLKASLLATEAEFEKMGWGNAETSNPIVGVLTGNDMGLLFGQLPIPEALNLDFGSGFTMLTDMLQSTLVASWDEKVLPGMLEWMKNEVIGPSLYGVLVSTEGWTVKEPDPEQDPEKWAEFSAAVMTKGLHQHPEREEVRTVLVVNAQRDFKVIRRIRGQEPEYSEMSFEERRANGHFGKEGRIPAAAETLMKLLIALMAHRGLGNEEVTKYWMPQSQGGLL